MKTLYSVIHIENLTLENITTFQVHSKALKEFERKILERYPHFDMLDMEEFLEEEALHYKTGSIQIVKHSLITK
jgi:hypothetical protein